MNYIKYFYFMIYKLLNLQSRGTYMKLVVHNDNNDLH